MLKGLEFYEERASVRVVTPAPEAHLGVAPRMKASLTEEERVVMAKVALVKALYHAYVFTPVDRLRITCIPNVADPGEPPRYLREQTLKLKTNRARFEKVNREMFRVGQVRELLEPVASGERWEWNVDLEMVFEETVDSRDVDALLEPLNQLSSLMTPQGSPAALATADVGAVNSIRLRARTGGRSKRTAESASEDSRGERQRTTARTTSVDVELTTSSPSPVEAHLEWYFVSQDRETRRRSVISRGEEVVTLSNEKGWGTQVQSDALMNTLTIRGRGRGNTDSDGRRTREASRFEGWIVRVVSKEGRVGAVQASSRALEDLGRTADLGGLKPSS
jgi:hypothetical protein